MKSHLTKIKVSLKHQKYLIIKVVSNDENSKLTSEVP